MAPMKGISVKAGIKYKRHSPSDLSHNSHYMPK